MAVLPVGGLRLQLWRGWALGERHGWGRVGLGGVHHLTGGARGGAHEPLPQVAIVGRPNVGKSTLFNRLTGRRDALMVNTPDDHVTRDVREGEATWGPLRFSVMDTPGFEPSAAEGSIQGRAMTLAASLIRRCEVAVLVVDGLHGTHPEDAAVLKWLRRHVSEVPVLLVANKCEGMHTHAMYGHEDAASLGCGAALPISAETSMGLAELYTALQRWIPGSASSHVRHTTRGARRRVEHVAAAAVRDWDREEGDTEEEEEEDGERAAMQLAIVGRPNAGKSTLVNRLLGHERVLTGPERGLTRDSIRLPMQHEGRPVWLVDTAGWEKKVTLKVGGSLKALPGEQAKRALNRAHVVAVLLDGRDYLDHGRLLRSEVALAAAAVAEGKAVVIVLNKADLIGAGQWHTVREQLQAEMKAWLPQVGSVPCVALSAADGEGVHELMPAAAALYDKWTQRVSTARLNRWLGRVALRNPTGALARIRYITQVKARPPSFAVFLRGKADFTDVDARTVTNSLREDFGFDGVPLRVLLRRQHWADHVERRSRTSATPQQAARAAATALSSLAAEKVPRTSARLLAHAGKGGGIASGRGTDRPKPRRRAYSRPRKSSMVNEPL